MILLADIGGTSGNWSLLRTQSDLDRNIPSRGYQPLTEDKEILEAILNSLDIAGQISDIKKVYYYGTACSLNRVKLRVENVLKTFFKDADIAVEGDLMGAVRGVCGKSKGVVCILGTGSSSCYFDGEKIKNQVPSLGHILGDEGGGNHMGRLLLRAYYYQNLNDEIREKARNEFNLDRDHIFGKLNSDSPSNYLASFVPFIYRHKNEESVHELIDVSLKSFINNHLLKYNINKDVPLYFIGSVAWYFSEELREIVKKEGLTISEVIKDPLEKIKEYHKIYG